MKLPNIPIDKLQHSFYGNISAFTFINICIVFNYSQWFSFFAQIVLWGLWKEITHDKLMKKGVPSFSDFVFSLIPYLLIISTINFIKSF